MKTQVPTNDVRAWVAFYAPEPLGSKITACLDRLDTVENELTELREAIPIITDDRFDADSAIQHLRLYKDDHG